MGKSREYYKRNLPHYQPDGYAIHVTFRLHGTLPVEVIRNFKLIKNKRLARISGYNNFKVRTEKYEQFKNDYFELFDDYINKCKTGNQWLRQKAIADIVKEAIHFRDRKEYDLIAYTIMPNHVHMIFIPIEKEPVTPGFVKQFEKELTKSPEDDMNESCDSFFSDEIKRNSVSLYKSETERNSVSLYKGETERNSVSLYRVTKILQDLKKFTAVKCNKALNRNGAFWQHESYDHVIRDSEELKRIVGYVLNNPVKAGLADTPEDWEYNYVNYEIIPVL